MSVLVAHPSSSPNLSWTEKIQYLSRCHEITLLQFKPTAASKLPFKPPPHDSNLTLMSGCFGLLGLRVFSPVYSNTNPVPPSPNSSFISPARRHSLLKQAMARLSSLKRRTSTCIKCKGCPCSPLGCNSSGERWTDAMRASSKLSELLPSVLHLSDVKKHALEDQCRCPGRWMAVCRESGSRESRSEHSKNKNSLLTNWRTNCWNSSKTQNVWSQVF